MRRLVPLLLLLAGGVQAYEEAEASAVDPLVQAVWHEPAVVDEGMQWEGFLQLHPGHGFDSAYYQICRVGRTCFAPPTLATRIQNDSFAFDTDDYQVAGRPVHYEGGWRLGVKWCLQSEADGADLCHWIPAQRGDDPEAHYFAFDVEGGDRRSPALPVPLLAILLFLAVMAWRRP